MKAKNKQEALKIIDAKLQEAKKLMEDCAKLAEHTGCVFSLPWGGEGTDQRGMGAYYVPEKATEDDKRAFCNETWGGDYYTGWQPSAGSC